jgi:hypothetical protein
MSSPITLARVAVVMAVGGCAATGVTLRSNHFRLAVPPDWQVVEAGGGESPTLVRAPASDGAPTVDVRLYPWVVHEAPADAAGDVLARLTAKDVLGLAAAQPDEHELCASRAAQFFVFGKPARAIHLTGTDGRKVVVTAGESHGSLVAVVGAIAPGTWGCAATMRMDAVIERVAASMTGGADAAHASPPPTLLDDPRGRPTYIPTVDPTPSP